MSVLASRYSVFSRMAHGDTILITANFSECGEFGGHRERIQIYPAKAHHLEATSTDGAAKHFAATWLLDTIGCSRPERRFFVAGRRAKLTATDEAFILSYIQQLTSYGQREQVAQHSGNMFRVVMPAGQPGLRVPDFEERWSQFDTLRNQLFRH